MFPTDARNRWNLGRGRQIVPGHAIHRSVLKRLRYDRPVSSLPSVLGSDSAITQSPIAINAPSLPNNDQDRKARTISDASQSSSTAPRDVAGGRGRGDGNKHSSVMRENVDLITTGNGNVKVNVKRGSSGKNDSGGGSGSGKRVGNPGAYLRGVRAGKTKRVYDRPKADLPVEWGTDWEELRLGGGPMIWEE